jgi:hypothetical protein
MNRLTKKVSLVLLSSSLTLGGCEESYHENRPTYVERPRPAPVYGPDGKILVEKEDQEQNLAQGSQTPGASGTPSNSSGTYPNSNRTVIYSSGGTYHSTPMFHPGLSGATSGSSSSSSSSSKGVSSLSGRSGTSSSSTSSVSHSSSVRGGFGSSGGHSSS